jgi:hypothetical protein
LRRQINFFFRLRSLSIRVEAAPWTQEAVEARIMTDEAQDFGEPRTWWLHWVKPNQNTEDKRIAAEYPDIKIETFPFVSQ